MTAKRLLIAFIFILLVMTVIVILIDRHSLRTSEVDKARAFQRYVHGIGLGASASPEWGFIDYDMRIDSVDDTNLWPMPGGYSYSPERLSVFGFGETMMNIEDGNKLKRRRQ
jgi:hypothetical protein